MTPESGVKNLPFLYAIDGAAILPLPWCEQFSLNSRSNAHCEGAAMAPLCKFVKRGAVRANDLPLSNDFETWPDSSDGRALDEQSQASRVRILLGSVIFSHFHFSEHYMKVSRKICNAEVCSMIRFFLVNSNN